MPKQKNDTGEKNKKTNWKRECPGCGTEIYYKNVSNYNLANRRNSRCLSCAIKDRYDIMQSPEVRKKKSISMKGKNAGENNGMYGYNWSDEQLKLLSEKNSGKNNGFYGKRHSDKTRQYLIDINTGKNNPNYGLKRSEKTKKKQRLSALKTLSIRKFNGGNVLTNYNPDACIIINWFNMYYDFNFQHAENGGEVCIDGYYPDGCDEKRKTLMEVDEPRHYDKNGNLKKRDIKRQNYLKSLGYTFIRIRLNKYNKVVSYAIY